MKVILSRKGFDSSKENGRVASPIFPDGQMMSLPIPSSPSPTTIRKLYPGRHDLGKIVEELTNGKVTRKEQIHLDPDLDSQALPRVPGWHPAFGQTNAAQTHLKDHGVGQGDLFLFFGWFREVELSKQGIWRYKPKSPNLHVIFGWLQIAQVLKVGDNTAQYKKEYPWLARHPHLHGHRDNNNTIYVGAGTRRSKYEKDGKNLGGGIFRSIKETLILTERGQHKRSVWKLPNWFYPTQDRVPLSYHHDMNRWTRTADGGTRLQSVAKGQEFVLDATQYPEIKAWILSLFK